MKLVILAAGQGTRMLPLTAEKPKAMVELKGKPLLQWALERAKKSGTKEIGVVVGFRKEKIIDFFGKEFQGMKITYIEQNISMGTANAVSLAEKFAGKQDFIVVHGDVIPGKGLLEKLSKKKGVDCVVVARETKVPEKYGCVEMKGKTVKAIIEKPSWWKEKTAWINAGIYRFNEKIFGALKKTKISKRGEFELTDSINILAKEGKVSCMKWEKEIIDIGNKEDLKKAGKMLE